MSSVLTPWSPYTITSLSPSSQCTTHTHHHTLLIYTTIVQIHHILEFLVSLTFLSNISIIMWFWTVMCMIPIISTIGAFNFGHILMSFSLVFFLVLCFFFVWISPWTAYSDCFSYWDNQLLCVQIPHSTHNVP